MPLRYFIPDWDDRVDPDYDFLKDLHTPGRNPYHDDRYAHELYDPPPYDGILVSRAVIEDNSRKRTDIQNLGSVHRYLRWPQDGQHTILGDCGAFTYWKDPEPPYTTPDMLEFYQSLGFDLGVSIDHLIFAELEAEKERRWQITITNAEEFLKLHISGGYTFTPIGVAQGWDPPSYRRAVESLMKMGYGYIAIGGLVRSQTQEILRVLHAIQDVLRPGTQVHLFGVSRPEYIHTFSQLGVTSFDSASRLRRAWMDGHNNYFLGNEAFTAIRVPESGALAKKHDLNVDEIHLAEQHLLALLRAFDHDPTLLNETLEQSLAYASLSKSLDTRTPADYQRTLERQPWKQCGCRICAHVGIEVIIFRGNNRNRRRGFHNTWQLYQQLTDMREAMPPMVPIITQLDLL